MHSDVKPNNVVLDTYCDWNDLFVTMPGNSSSNYTVAINEASHVSLVDFGLSERYLEQDPNNGEWRHINFEKINRTLGNKFFMSLNQLKKYGISYSTLTF